MKDKPKNITLEEVESAMDHTKLCLDDMLEQFDVKMGAIRQLFEDKNKKHTGVWK